MEGKIVKSVNPGVTELEVERGGTTNFCSWERLKPYLEQASGLRDNEEVIGLVATKDGLEIRLRYK